MKPLIINTVRHLIGLMALIFTFGCGFLGTRLTQPANTLTPTEIGTSLPGPTWTSNNPLPTNAVSPTKTKTISITQTLTIHASPLSPPLSSAEAQSIFLNLLEDNGGCKLPCWLGLIPGNTKAQDAKLFIEKFADISKGMILNDNGGYLALYIPQNDVIFTPRFEYQFPISGTRIERLTAEILAVRKIEGGVEYVYDNPIISRFLQTYSPSNILTTYGNPSEVLVFGDRRAQEFQVLLSYSDAGFLINYHISML